MKEIPSESENIYTTIKFLMELKGIPITEEINRCEGYTHSVIFYELNCADQTIIPVFSRDYDREGNVLYSCTTEKEAAREIMEFGRFDTRIVPETVWDGLFRAVCQQE